MSKSASTRHERALWLRTVAPLELFDRTSSVSLAAEGPASALPDTQMLVTGVHYPPYWFGSWPPPPLVGMAALFSSMRYGLQYRIASRAVAHLLLAAQCCLPLQYRVREYIEQILCHRMKGNLARGH
ncbi:uncharacterized protein TRIREDRAFT_103276 [Trichoderma reesei QM6a]|uniref:Predicted protein n=2 Tax=Hypocrea jecorina TaxID=51453 RepID=G0R7A7_HYPJQ|nr:uncharacterized protein TRIREDRAFT_103276 [Trichoderma reesei QM6a]EGR53091.1 predicted protein [Trichoderma reesei QM6a]ETR99987.1 hypothetical protein M419DRAFT_132046 [Trichoderma reesei RUT C-30]